MLGIGFTPTLEPAVIECTCTAKLPKASLQTTQTSKQQYNTFTPCIYSMMQTVVLSYTAIVYQTLHALM